MSTDTRRQIETRLRDFSGSDLRNAAMGLLTALGYESEEDQSFQLKQAYMTNRNAGAQRLRHPLAAPSCLVVAIGEGGSPVV
jgi:hypothetical protein